MTQATPVEPITQRRDENERPLGLHDRGNERFLPVPLVRHNPQGGLRRVGDDHAESPGPLRGESLHAEGAAPPLHHREHPRHAHLLVGTPARLGTSFAFRPEPNNKSGSSDHTCLIVGR